MNRGATKAQDAPTPAPAEEPAAQVEEAPAATAESAPAAEAPGKSKQFGDLSAKIRAKIDAANATE